MPLLKQVDAEQIESWRPSRICCLFMTGYNLKESHPENTDLESLAQQLSTASLKRRIEIRNVLQQEMAKRARTEDYNGAATFRDMLRYYEQHVMG